MLFRYTKIFAKERFPLGSSLCFCTILFFVVHHQLFLNMGAIVGFSVSFLALLIMRFADDYTDIDIDKVKTPKRSLSNGKIPPLLILREMTILSLMLLSLMVVTPEAWYIYVIAAIAYGIFLIPKRKIPVGLHPWLDKAWFMLVPLYSQLMIDGKISMMGWLWSAFFYLATVAHSYGHSIREKKPGETIPELGTDAPKLLAVSAVVLYGLSLWPAYLIILRTQSLAFLLALVATTSWLAIYLTQLLFNPSQANSRHLYVRGYLFFVLPSLAYLLEGTIKRLLVR